MSRQAPNTERVTSFDLGNGTLHGAPNASAAPAVRVPGCVLPRGSGSAGQPLTPLSPTARIWVLTHPSDRSRPRPLSAAPREGKSRPCSRKRLPSIANPPERPFERCRRLGTDPATSPSQSGVRRRFARRSFPLWAIPAATSSACALNVTWGVGVADRLLQQARDVDTSTRHAIPARGLAAASHAAHAAVADRGAAGDARSPRAPLRRSSTSSRGNDSRRIRSSPGSSARGHPLSLERACEAWRSLVAVARAKDPPPS